MKKTTLSVVLATYNEEKNLRACLESVRDLADEIVIVDGSSSDNTVAIAKEFGARVKTTTNKPNFHINKQMAIDMAKSDWILQLDADEHVSEGLAKEIRVVIKNVKPEINGYWMPRKNYFLGRFLMKGGQYPDYTIRLYKKGKGRLPQKDVHEQAVVDGKVDYLKNALLHYPYENFRSYITKWSRYNNFQASQLKEEFSEKNLIQKVFLALGYLLLRPAHWFLTTYLRHKGFVDGWQGFVFSLFSALRFPVSYIIYFGYFKFLILLILFFSFFFRFYNFHNRWGIAGDDSRDALIALEAIRRSEWPLTGSFSSAGPFVFGGIFYWFIMVCYMVLPFIWSPWFVTSIIGVLTVLMFIYIGKELGGRTLGIIAGIFAATSPQLVSRSLTLGQHTYISTFTALVLLSILFLIRTKKKIFAFITGLSIGLAVNFHYQSVNLLIFFPAIFLIPVLKMKEKIWAFSLMLLGFIIPMLPLIFWDVQQSFANFRNLADYLLIGQNRIYVPNSWRLFVLDFLPGYWAFVLGHFRIIAAVSIITSFGMFAYYSVRKKISSKILFLWVIFIVLLIVNRYYKGERSESYLLYFAPFIIVFVSWSLSELVKMRNKLLKISAIILVGLMVSANLLGVYSTLNYESPYTRLRAVADKLYAKYPDVKFSIYDYKYLQYSVSMPLSLIMVFDGKQGPEGKRIGVSCFAGPCPEKNPPIIIREGALIVDLEKVPGAKLGAKNDWIGVNQENAYEDLTGWLNKHQLKSTFHFDKYIEDKFIK